jgi:2-polyprenyl-3-methyl-5-hydroxy-6-metoxy-1,4-benzoquinol methylase
MPAFSHRSYQTELLDQPDIPFEDIRRNMQELNFINTYLGGHNITLAGLKALTGQRTSIHVCEIGCGGGDNLMAIRKWCLKHKISVSFTGIDINPHCIEVAREQFPGNDMHLITSDYKAVRFDQKPDIIFSSLFCHHFTDEEMVSQLQWMHQQATIGFFINDLHRHPFAYYSIKWLTAIFSKSYMVKNDAPISVTRGFTKKEWLQLLNTAGIANFSVQWKWAYRWLVVVNSNEIRNEKC